MLPLSALAPLLLLAPSALASILAVDYGAEWTKISLVKPGTPFDVVLNKDSKRKVQSVVGWKKDERLFGGEASAISGRFPHDTYPFLKPHLGHPLSSETTTLFPSIIKASGNLSRSSGKEEWSVEELVGMQFSYARDLAETLAGEAVRDAIVSVPGWFSQSERQAVMDALEIGGLRPVGLINDGTAVIMNYAMTRQFPEKEYHLVYDSGALSTSATLLSLHTYPAVPQSALVSKKSKLKPKAVNTTHVEVIGLGWDRELGGYMLEQTIREALIEEFETKVLKGGKIQGAEKEKALAKVAKEAIKVKNVLSANAESSVNIESFFNDLDFRSRYTREQLETASAHLIGQKRFEQPIHDALKMAGLTVTDLKSLIVFGGNTRVPFVQAAIKAAVGENKIAQNVNTDEAAVLGAAFYGATQSRQFKTKVFKVTDLNPYDIQTSYVTENKGINAAAVRTIHTLLFPVGSKTGIKKTIKLRRKADFDLTFSYKGEDLPFSSSIFNARLSGLTDALANLTEVEKTLNPDPTVKVTVQISPVTGLVEVVDAALSIETVKVEEEATLGSRLKGFFSGSKADGEEGTEAKVEGEEIKEEGTAAAPSASSTKKEEKKAAEAAAEKKEEKVERLIELEVIVSYPEDAITPLSSDAKKISRSRLVSIDALEESRRIREEALNHLESYLYRIRDLVDPYNEDSIFWQYSTEDERDRLREGMRETLDWLSEDGWEAPTTMLKEQSAKLENIERPIQFRNTEAQKRKTSIEKFQQALFAGRAFMQSAQQNETADLEAGLAPKYTKEELEGIQTHMTDLEGWLGPLMEQQHPKKQNEDPILLTRDLEEKGAVFQQRVLNLLRRKTPERKRPKKEKKVETEAERGDRQPAREGGETAAKEGEEVPIKKAESEQPPAKEGTEEQTPESEPMRPKDEL